MALNQTTRSKLWATAQTAKLGHAEFKKQESDKRAQRRRKAKAAKAAAALVAPVPLEQKKELELKKLKLDEKNRRRRETRAAKAAVAPAPLERKEELEFKDAGVIVPRIPPKLPPTGVKKTPPPLPPKLSKCELLLERIYAKKVKYLASLVPPRTVKKSSTTQQFNRVMNIHKFMIGDIANCDNLNWLRDTEKIVDFINGRYKTASSRNVQISSISSVLFGMDEYKTEYDFYSKLSTNNVKQIKEVQGENVLTPNEEKNIMSWDDIQKMTSDITDIRDKALISLYVLFPPRRMDYFVLKVGDGDDVNFNYFTDAGITFNKYKTDKIYKQQKFAISDELRVVLNAYIRDYNLKDGDLMFGRTTTKPYKNPSQYLSALLKKYTPKTISVNILRHSYISEFLKQPRSVNEMKAVAERMAHSTTEQKKYFRFGIK